MAPCPHRLDIATDAAGLRVARVELAAALRAAALYGFNEGIDNHFSLVVPGRSDSFLLNPYGPHWSEMRAADLLTIGLGGERLAGEGELDRTAFTIHLGAHRARPGRRVRPAHAHAVRHGARDDGGRLRHAGQPERDVLPRPRRASRLRRARRGRGGGRAHRGGARATASRCCSWTTTACSSSASRWPTPGTSSTSSSAPARCRCSRSRPARRCCRCPRSVAQHTAAQFRRHRRPGRVVRRGATRARSRQSRLRAVIAPPRADAHGRRRGLRGAEPGGGGCHRDHACAASPMRCCCWRRAIRRWARIASWPSGTSAARSTLAAARCATRRVRGPRGG